MDATRLQLHAFPNNRFSTFDMMSLYTLDDLRAWPAREETAGHRLSLAVLGWPVEHSLSPVFQNAALEHESRGMRYVRIAISPEELPEALRFMEQHGFLGTNLTIPHKQAVLSMLASVDPLAQKIGAVNTIRFDADGPRGFNTDAPALTRTIRDAFGVDLRDLRILILGLGGAGRAYAFQCAAEGCERLVLVNRTEQKAQALATELGPNFNTAKVDGPSARITARRWNEVVLKEELETIDLLIHATPVGLRRSDPSPLHDSLLAPHLLVFDAVYGRGRTPLVEAATRMGARAIDGSSMLVEQGALSYEIWFESDAPRVAMREALTKAANMPQS